MGQVAAQTLIDDMTGTTKNPRHVVLENTLIQRTSTIPLEK
jgi:LacI family transcriptional regulator